MELNRPFLVIQIPFSFLKSPFSRDPPSASWKNRLDLVYRLDLVVVTTPHTDANSIQKDNHQLSTQFKKTKRGAPLSAPNSAYTKVAWKLPDPAQTPQPSSW